MKKFSIGMDAWIIQDGNYRDFVVSSVENFALEFFCPVPKFSNSGNVSITQKYHCHYIGSGEAIYVDETSWFLNFGDFVACQVGPPPPEVKIGSYVTGEFYIGIDPFMYREQVFPKSGTPKIIEKWQIKHILLETTPWETVGRIMKRASESKTYISVGGTDAWADDDGHASYVLECERLPPQLVKEDADKQPWIGYVKPSS